MTDPVFYAAVQLGKCFIVSSRDKYRIVPKPLSPTEFRADNAFAHPFGGNNFLFGRYKHQDAPEPGLPLFLRAGL